MTTFKPRTSLVLTVAKKPRSEEVRTEPLSVPVVNLRQGMMERIELSAGELMRLSDANRWRIIVCRRGRVWVTQEADVRDYVLEPGQMFVIAQPGTVILQALRDAELVLTPALQTIPYRGRYEDAVFS